jgi:ketosteroid isomerase-like protein
MRCGREQARNFLESFLEAWESLTYEPDEMIDLEGDQVLTASRLRMRGHASGVDVNAKGASIWTIREGKMAAVTLFQSKADALEAAGLSE